MRPDDADDVQADICAGARAGSATRRPARSPCGPSTAARTLTAARSPDESPDLMVHCAPGYRIGWGSSMGGVPAELFEDNRSPGPATTSSIPRPVPGVLFMDRPFRGSGARASSTWPRRSSPRWAPRGPDDGRESAAVMKILVIGLDCAAPELLLEESASPTSAAYGGGLFTGGWRASSRRSPCRRGCACPPAAIPARWASTASATGSTTPTTACGPPTPARSGAVTIWDHLAREGRRSVIIGVPPSYPPRRVNGISVGCFLTPDPPMRSSPTPRVGERDPLLVGDYPVDVKGFRTENKAWLRDDILSMTRKQLRWSATSSSDEEWDYFQFVDIGLDRVHHGFWKHHDPDHVAHDPDSPLRDVIRGYYRHLDDEIGTVLELLDEDTVVLVVSDHGARQLDGGFCVNEWLVREGYLVLAPDPPRSPPSTSWTSTGAAPGRGATGGYYARVFLNVKGREPEGVIEAGDYERVRTELTAAAGGHHRPRGQAPGHAGLQARRDLRPGRGHRAGPHRALRRPGLAGRGRGGVRHGPRAGERHRSGRLQPRAARRLRVGGARSPRAG